MEKIKFIDKPLTCVDCEEEFIFSAGEQAYFQSKQLSVPRRCPECRRRRRESLVKAVQK